MGIVPSSHVQIREGVVRVIAQSRDEAKLALKELKFMKKEYGLRKRVVMDEQKAIRARYTEEVRTRGSVMRGGGGIGRIVRAFQAAARDNRRAELARDLAPLEREKQKIEDVIRAIDSVILQVEANLLRTR